MMKKIIALCFLSSLNLGHADQGLTEIVWLNALLDISKCEARVNDTPMCGREGSLGRNIPIFLDTCSSENGYELCSGHFELINNRDDIPFYGFIGVERKTWEASDPQYSIILSLGTNLSSIEPSGAVTITPRYGHELTDFVTVEGTRFWADTQYFYESRLIVGPPAPHPVARK